VAPAPALARTLSFPKHVSLTVGAAQQLSQKQSLLNQIAFWLSTAHMSYFHKPQLTAAFFKSHNPTNSAYL
jgi:hypothetical protein